LAQAIPAQAPAVGTAARARLPMAPIRPQCAALDAARGAGLAMHAASGLSAGVSREATRLLRAAEGLCRAAVATLAAAASEPAAPPGAAGAGAPQRRRRPRARRQQAAGGLGTAVAAADAPKGQEAAPEAQAGDEHAGHFVHPVFVAAAGNFARNQTALRDRTLGDPNLDEAASSEAAPRQQKRAGPRDPDFDLGGVDVELSNAGAASSRGPLKSCVCGYAEPLSRKRRCKGCGWVYSAKDYRELDDCFSSDARPAGAGPQVQQQPG